MASNAPDDDVSKVEDAGPSVVDLEEPDAPTFKNKEGAIAVIVLGMAGSGKTTLVHQMTSHLYDEDNAPYVINLDPACADVPYPAHIDIRDTVKYKEIMQKFKLGPNGGIITSLNLFSTRFDQVLNLIEKRRHDHEFVIFDTPGQIEVFTWSASGTIITEALASSFPTVVVYVMDIERSSSPITFMSNMLYACSILYKTKLPFLIVFNKIDVKEPGFAKEWMSDWTKFEESVGSETSFMGSLTRSLSLVLDEFYTNIKTVGVSSITGEGMVDLFDEIKEVSKEWFTDYKPELERIKKMQQKEAENKELGIKKEDTEEDKEIKDHRDKLEVKKAQVLSDQEKVMSKYAKGNSLITFGASGSSMMDIPYENFQIGGDGEEEEEEEDEEEINEYIKFKRELDALKEVQTDP